MADKQVKAWITRNGKHIPIYESSTNRQPATQSEYAQALKSRDLAHQAFNQTSKKRANLNSIGDTSVADSYRKLVNAEKDVEDIEKRGIIKSVKVKKSVPQQNADIREKQIAESKAQADKLNGKSDLNADQMRDFIEQKGRSDILHRLVYTNGMKYENALKMTYERIINEEKGRKLQAQADKARALKMGSSSSVGSLKTQAEINNYLKNLEAEMRRGSMPRHTYNLLKQRALAQREKLSQK